MQQSLSFLPTTTLKSTNPSTESSLSTPLLHVLLSSSLKASSCTHFLSPKFSSPLLSDVFVLVDVTYGACCVDDLSAAPLGADLLIHYGHSCLVPVDNTFAGAIRIAKVELEKLGFRVFVPQAKPLSAGEVLGCTAPRVSWIDFGDGIEGDEEDLVIVFVADGRFHLEAFTIANPGVKAFRYDPYLGRLFLGEYDHRGMKSSRMKAVLKAKEAKSWGVVLGTLGRQGNPRILDRLERKMEEKRMSWTVVLKSEISPSRIVLFEDSIDAWIQVACPRLLIDWGEAFEKPLLNPFEAEIALGIICGWWERDDSGVGVDCRSNGGSCGCDNETNKSGIGNGVDYPMDYYAQDGGEWNSCYMKGKHHPTRRNLLSSVATGGVS